MADSIIIALSGKMGAGKNTLACCISDILYTWQSRSVLEVAAATGGSFIGDNFVPDGNIIQVAFADLIKEFCIDVLGLEHKQCYGTDEDKNTFTKYLWDNTPNNHFKGKMTARETMQIFGTECVRNWFGNVWAQATLRKIYKLNPAVAIITDNRFPNEVETILAYPHGHVVRLTRNPFEDTHSSETALDKFNWSHKNCYVLDNANLSIEEQAKKIIPILWNIFQQEFSNG